MLSYVFLSVFTKNSCINTASPTTTPSLVVTESMHDTSVLILRLVKLVNASVNFSFLSTSLNSLLEMTLINLSCSNEINPTLFKSRYFVVLFDRC
jgi:hypothetical protein